jgi:hypothetical protein
MRAEGSETVQDGKESEQCKDVYILRLYVAGQTRKSLAAFSNLKKICEEHLEGRYKIEVIGYTYASETTASTFKEDYRRSIRHREGVGRSRSQTSIQVD